MLTFWQVGDSSYVTDYPAISCQESRYTQLRPLFIALAAIVVAAFPAFVVVFLVIAKAKGYLHNDPLFARKFGVLYALLFVRC